LIALLLPACFRAAPSPEASTPLVATAAEAPPPPPPPAPPPPPEPPPPPVHARPWVDPASVGKAWGTTTGILQFRGNPTHTWYGTGPVPRIAPKLLWQFPPKDEPGMCAVSHASGVEKTWCGTGWTGQPSLVERPDGKTMLVVGAYDDKIHFLDAATGKRLLQDLPTQDIVKGSVSVDPDGFPLVYSGATDGKYRVIAWDRDPPELLWAIDAQKPPYLTHWNDDFDSNGSIVDGKAIVGGEDGLLFVVELNRAYGPDGKVTVNPQVLATAESVTPESLAVGPHDGSIESSPAIYGNTAYITCSNGRIAGIDLSKAEQGLAPAIFDYEMGDDTDASVVIAPDGTIFVASELEISSPRGLAVGQLVHLDPSKPDPVLWKLDIPKVEGDSVDKGGIWATPALGDGVLYAPTEGGRLLAVDVATGEITWEDKIGFHAWSSPAVVDGLLIVTTDCTIGGKLVAYDLADPRHPSKVWETPYRWGCMESTPAVWKGKVYVGSRSGYLLAWGVEETDAQP
jgi:outer membrane protein assembly factor BamB